MVRGSLASLGLLTALVATSSACGAGFIDGNFGVTPGGAQDIELARQLIESGGVPQAEQFTAEGLFSQHDFSAPATSPCEQLLCPRASIASVEPVDGSGQQMLVHLALDTNIESLERAPLNLALVVDISGSMAGEKLDSTKLALHSIVDQLDEGDRVTLVSFSDDARIEVPSTIADEGGRQSLHAAISNLHTEGGTNIEAGLALGYDEVDIHHDGLGGNEDRVMLLTDAQPNVGATDTGSFLGIVNSGADAGIGVSVFGVGLDLGAELATQISEVRGGNSFYLSASALTSLFEDHFVEIVTPVAYSMQFNVRSGTGFELAKTYGTPDIDADGEVEFSVATGFLSSNGGAMAVLLEGDPSEAIDGQAVVTFSLEYQTPEGDVLADTFDVHWLGGDLPISDGGWADHAGSAKLAVLLDEYLALEAGAAACAGDLPKPEAVTRIEEAAARLDAMGELLDDQPLRDEADLMRKLVENLTSDGCLYNW